MCEGWIFLERDEIINSIDERFARMYFHRVPNNLDST